ncbi:MAG: hypothetical protein AB1413_11685 [Thermodesulfobacteriota bacterium]
MKLLLSFVVTLVAFGLLDLAMRKFAAWRKAKRPAAPHYAGPTPAEHERNLKKGIGQFANAHATANWERGAIAHYEKTGRVSKRSSNPFADDDVTTDAAYSSLGSNIFND